MLSHALFFWIEIFSMEIFLTEIFFLLPLRAVRQRPLLSAFMKSTKSGQEKGASLLSCWSCRNNIFSMNININIFNIPPPTKQSPEPMTREKII